MTDLEMERLCAVAMGLKPRTVKDGAWDAPGQPDYGHDGVYLYDAGSNLWGKLYSPLVNDEQAMALVKNFQLNVAPSVEGRPAVEGWTVALYNGEGEVFSHDLNRAIVECVAKMQAAEHAS
jgi:hypothetical protein